MMAVDLVNAFLVFYHIILTCYHLAAIPPLADAYAAAVLLSRLLFLSVSYPFQLIPP